MGLFTRQATSTGSNDNPFAGGFARLAGGLIAAGVEPGDRVMLVAPSVPEFVAAYLGIHAAGAVAVTPNVMSAVPELEYVAVDAGCSLVIAWHEADRAAATVAAAHGLPFHRLEAGPGGGLDGPPVARPHDRSPDETAVPARRSEARDPGLTPAASARRWKLQAIKGSSITIPIAARQSRPLFELLAAHRA